MIDEQLTSVHEALQEATLEPRATKAEERAMGTFTFRVHKVSREAAQDICKRHGTTLADYLRKCIEALPRDYRP